MPDWLFDLVAIYALGVAPAITIGALALCAAAARGDRHAERTIRKEDHDA